ncbi:MAG: hypothetical protein QOJ97_1461 [Solirubrobacteraceae bacterium]|jgi:hypothetical protein|nr:hypothetical protein [Solirubrobacteraceae bacterium]
MSNPVRIKRPGRAAAVLAVLFAFIAVPAVAQASPVDLATARPFVVLGGQEVTNTGPSVLNGDLGVAPGTSLTGFGSPAVVNGATHNNDGVANQAQADLTTAYNVAAGQTPATNLTGQNLGGLTLAAGAYKYTSSAFLTGTLTLDAANDPNAQFVIQIGSSLTTASASRVELVRGASPCNVYWQIGSSATLGTTTRFQGNLMALTSISLNNGASVTGRVLARNGTVSLINNVLDASRCGTSTSPPSSGTTPGSTPTSGGAPGTGTGQPGSPTTAAPTRNGTSIIWGPPRRQACTDGFRATVRGRMIKRVVFSLDGRRVRNLARSPFTAYVRATPGRHTVTARVTFKDATRARTLRVAYRGCAAAVLRPRPGPSRFTG